MTVTDRHRIVLQHVARFRLSTAEAIKTIVALRLKTTANALAFLRQLVAEGWLGEASFDRHGPYFFLTPRGAQLVQSPRSGPLSESAKLRAFALLAFCRLMGTPRERLSADDLRRLVPNWNIGGMSTTFYAERTANTRSLGFARLDVGSVGRWDRILATLAEDLRGFAAEPALRPLIANRAFAITLLTLTPEKAARLRDTFAEKHDPTFPVYFVPVPRLLALSGAIRAPPIP